MLTLKLDFHVTNKQLGVNGAPTEILKHHGSADTLGISEPSPAVTRASQTLSPPRQGPGWRSPMGH